MINFFDPAYQESTNAHQFGLCDNEDGTAAFIDTDDIAGNKWIATVENPNGFALTFTAIDKGVIKDDVNVERCDGMLASNDNLYFIELKNLRRSWVSKGISQLGSTIELFDAAHPGKKDQYKHRKAFICNRKHPNYHVSRITRNLEFFKTYSFHLYCQAIIKMD